jgi:spermidine/putrescine transport system substrate-binding protein
MTESRSLASPITRRRFLQLGGAAGAGAFLAACGTNSATPTPVPTPSPAPSVAPSAAPSAAASPQVGGAFRMATWSGYIDIAEDLSYPSLDRFTEETGVVIDYQEAVEDNQIFFSTDLQGPIDAGQPTGWDIVVLTDWMVQRLVSLGWLETIAETPNYPANLEATYTGRAWDPGNTLAAPYVSGLTGLGYDKKVTGDLSSLEILFQDTYAGRVTYLSEMNDTVGLAALVDGNDPDTLDQAGFDAAIARITAAIDAGIVRRMTGNSYLEDMTSGDVVLAIAWSGDVAGTLSPLNDADREFVFTLADEGGMIWTDNMVIPKGAENKVQAETFIDWYYNPANAAEIIAFVRYVCPVKGTAEALAEIDPSAAEDPLIFPTAEMVERLHEFVSQDPDARAEWEATFAEAIGL